MMDAFSKIIEKLNIAKPELYFTTDENGGGDRHVRYGFYEIKNSCFGPVMFRFYEDRLVDGSPISVVAVRVKNSNFEHREYDMAHNEKFYATLNFLQKANKTDTKIISKVASNNWNKFLSKPNPNSKLDVRPGITALQSFEAFMTVVNRHRPYEPSDFVPESFIPDLAVALLMTANFAGAPVWLKNAVPQNKKVATVANQQSRTQANCINYFTALQKVKGR